MALTTNLIANHEFNDGSGTTALDSTANNLDATLVGSPSWTASAKLGSNAIVLNGSSQYANVSTSDVLSQEISFNIWVYHTGGNSYRATIIESAVISQGSPGNRGSWHGISIEINDGILRAFLAGDSTSLEAFSLADTVTFPENQWVMVTLVANRTNGPGSSAFLYKNNTQVDSSTANTFVSGIDSQFDIPDGYRLGSFREADDRYFDGRMDSASLWTKLLTSTERDDLYNAGAGIEYPFTGITTPTVTTQAASSITDTTVTLNGNVTALGDETTVDTAFDYRVVGAGSWTRTTPDTGVTATGAYTKGITGLTAAEDYEYRSVVIYNTTEEVYGSEVTFTTASGPTAPTVTTQAVTSITETTATGNGNVTDDGGATITERGVAVSTSATPTTGDTTFTSAGTTGAFTASMTGLTGSTLYYVRAYAINAEGTSYGSEVTFTTASGPTAPTVTTQAVTDVATTTATGNGNVTADGGETVTERGVCWSTTTAPTTADSTATSAGTTGAFTSAITGLSGSTLYYVRAYASNSEGTSYGSEVTFTTTEVTVPKYAAYTKIAGELVRIS